MPAAEDDSSGPLRTCIGCRRRAGHDALVRIVRTADGGLTVGRGRPGRGAWICPDPACWALARRRGAWARALRGPVSEEAIGSLVPILEARAGEGSPL